MFDKALRRLRGPESELLLADSSKNDQSALETDAERPNRTGLIILAIAFGSFVLWASTAPIDEGVPAPGQVALSSKGKTVQHLTGGIVAEVLVREGESVDAGQVLLKMRDAQARAAYDSALHAHYSLTAARARLVAEQNGARSITFGSDLANDQHPLARQHRLAQIELFQARHTAQEGDLSVLRESTAAAEISAQGAESQLRLLSEQLVGISDLVKEGYAPRNQKLELERQAMELSSQARRARSQAAELRLRAIQFTNQFRRDVEAQLADVTRDQALAQQRLQAAAEDLERTVVKAPTQGQVIGLLTQMVGAVVTPGQRLMDIVPKDESLVLEVHIPPALIDHVRVGLLADLSFDAFASKRQLKIIEGQVTSIAGDVLTEQGPAGVNTFYLARVSVTPEGLKTLGDNRLQPGMAATVVIKTGERTFFTYLIAPIMHRLHTSLKEA